jgi:UDPglucose 6-dehydrogenase
MVAGMGDGGPCHPRDNIALRYMTKELNLNYDLFDSIMYSREQQARNLAKFLVDLSVEHGLPILIHGYTYKPNVPYTDGSYSALVGYYCEQLNYHPTYVDPNTHPEAGPFSAVVLLAHNIKELYCELPKDCIIVDPWRTFSKDGVYKVIHYGDTR